MKTSYWLVLGAVAALGFQVSACSADFRSCESSQSCDAAAASDGVGTGALPGDMGVGAAGEAGNTGVTPKLFGACSTLGSVVCQGNALPERLACDGAQWQAGTTCAAGELCDSATGACAQPVTECATATPGAVVCRGNRPVTCGPDLVTVTLGEACMGTCKDGACLAPS